MVEGVLSQITEQLAQLFGAVQRMAVHQLIDLTEILLSFDQLVPP